MPPAPEIPQQVPAAPVQPGVDSVHHAEDEKARIAQILSEMHNVAFQSNHLTPPVEKPVLSSDIAPLDSEQVAHHGFIHAIRDAWLGITKGHEAEASQAYLDIIAAKQKTAK